jgi:2-methylcitrate dehydratase PrpD
MQLTSKKTPQTGLEGKFSIYHAASVAFIEGAGGVNQFSDRAVGDAKVASLRDRVSVTIDSTLREDQVRIAVTTKDGQQFNKFVEHAIGSVDHPMSDSALEAKFASLADGTLPSDRQRRLMDLCWNIETLPDVSVIPKAAVIS